MSYFLFKRSVTFIATLTGASAIVFFALEILPGDPAYSILGADSEASAYQALRNNLGLDQPATERYFNWIFALLRGDFGISYTYSTPVFELVLERLSLTIPLALITMAITVLFALVLGVYAAAKYNKLGDWSVMAFSQIGIAIPNFWLGIMLILFFSVYLGWLPAGGFPGWHLGIFNALQSLFLPSFALATVQVAILARVTRSSILETIGEDFVRTARAKGLSQRATLYRHVLRNALIPITTIMGLQFANLLAGTIIVENVFFLPGLGRLVFEAIANRDLAIVRGVVMVLMAMVVTVNFLVDLSYMIVDPRLRTFTT